MSCLGQIEIAETSRKEDLTVEWRVGNFFSLSGYWGDSYESPLFGFSDGCWLMRLFPNVRTVNPASDRMMALYLARRDSSGPSRTVLFTFGIKAVDGIMKKRAAQHEFSTIDSHGYDEIWSRCELKDHEARMMPDDVLTITCELKVVQEPGAAGGALYQDASSQTQGEFRVANGDTGESQSLDRQNTAIQTDGNFKELATLTGGNQLSEKQGIEKVVADVGKLLVSGAIGDITVHVGEVQFEVDRDVLLSRSPALQQDISEGTSSRTSEPDVFGDFVHCIYTKSVQFLTAQNVFGLYRVADKYRMGDLKLQCLEHMRDTLLVQTFCDTVRLALSHGESDLLELALDFGRNNFQSIICSEEWRDFNSEHPKEANDILVKCICTKN